MSTTVHDKLYALTSIIRILDEDATNSCDEESEVLGEFVKGGLLKSAQCLVDQITDQLDLPEEYTVVATHRTQLRATH